MVASRVFNVIPQLIRDFGPNNMTYTSDSRNLYYKAETYLKSGTEWFRKERDFTVGYGECVGNRKLTRSLIMSIAMN